MPRRSVRYGIVTRADLVRPGGHPRIYTEPS